MDQIHRRFSSDHVRNLLRGYTEGLLERPAVEETLGIGKSRFFALLRVYRSDPEAFTITYQRSTPKKLAAAWEEEIREALLAEKALVENQDLPISSYRPSGTDCSNKGFEFPSPRSSLERRLWGATWNVPRRNSMIGRF